jgi:hypothetical protein
MAPTAPNAPPRAFDDYFVKLPGERSVPIDNTQHEFEFTRRWFRNRNQATWSTFLLPRFGDGRRVAMLQIGVFEGADLVWCCQQLLKHPGSRALAIDPWDPMPPKWPADKIQAVEARAHANLAPWADKVKLVKAYSQEYLVHTPPAKRFDLMVIDGDHDAKMVFQDASLSLALAKPGAWMVFDDVRNARRKRNHVQQGIERFLTIFGDKVKLAWQHRHCDCYTVL